MSKDDLDVKNFKCYPYIPVTSLEAKQKEYYAKNIMKNVYPSPITSVKSSLISSEKSTPKIVCDTPVSAYNAITFEKQAIQEQEELTEKLNELNKQIAENEIMANIQKTTIETHKNTIKEQQEKIRENEKQIKKQEFAITYNTTISEQVIQNVNSLNVEITNKASMLNILNKHTLDAQAHLQDLQTKINNSQVTLENLQAGIYNCQQELSYHRTMLNQIHTMIQNPQYIHQMMIPYEVNDIY